MENPRSFFMFYSQCGCVCHLMQDPQRRICYVGSSKNLQDRWANHKSDARLERVSKCSVAPRVRAAEQASLGTFSHLQILTTEAVYDESFFSREKTWWPYKATLAPPSRASVSEDSQYMARTKSNKKQKTKTKPTRIPY